MEGSTAGWCCLVFLLIQLDHGGDCAQLQAFNEDRNGNASCVGDAVFFTCIVPAIAHDWRIPSLGFIATINRINPTFPGPGDPASPFSIATIEDEGGSNPIATQLSVTSSAELNGTNIICSDANQIATEIQEATIVVFGPPSAPGLTVVPVGDLASFDFTITPSIPPDCVVNYTITAIGSGGSRRFITVPASEVDGFTPVTVGSFDLRTNVYNFTVAADTIEGIGPSSQIYQTDQTEGPGDGGSLAMACQQAEPYAGSVCTNPLTSLQTCYSGMTSPPTGLNIPSVLVPDQGVAEASAQNLLNGLRFLTPSEECAVAIMPFICLINFPLCDAEDEVHVVLREACMELRDNICMREWATAIAFLGSGVLPVCEDLPDISDECVAITTATPPISVSNLQVTTRTDTTLAITWTVSGSIDRFEVTYSYTVNRCSAPQGAPRTDTISDGSMRSYTLTGLNEDSRYTITVRAINTAGSGMATIAIDTLTSAPSGIPGSISFRDINLTSITVQWTELPCSDRNGEITGYTVEYSSTTPPHNNIVIASGSSNTRVVVGGLLPRTNYTFSVRAQGAANARSGTRFTATPTGVGFFLNGRVLPDNSAVLLSDIGEGSSALYCLTDRVLCCSVEAGANLGRWEFPDSGGIVSSATTADIYSSKGFSSLLLNRRSSAVGPTGVYTCSIPDAGNNLRFLSISITTLGPVSNLQVTTRSATTLTITWTVSGFIDRFEVTYSYTVNRCSAPQGAPRTDTISDGSMRAHTLRDLNEDSSYTITVRAINTAGSTMATVTASTLPSAPSGNPGPISFSDVNLTSITVQWTELPCGDRNGEITGYTVEYSSTTPPPHTNTVTVSGSSSTRVVVGGLLPRTSYTFSVRAQGDGSSDSTTATIFTATAIDVGFFLNGRVLPNNSIVAPGDIGEGSGALYCLTDRTQCCSTEAGGELGVWRSPDGSDVSGSTIADVYLVRGFSSLLLNRRSSAVGPTGVYTCLIPDAGNVVRTLYVGVDDDITDISCPVGMYLVTTSNGSVVCTSCPANSVSVSANSRGCLCIQGYYRNPLEDIHVGCTRPPSVARNFQVLESQTRANTITVMWERPLITGRDDYFYNIQYSNPDIPGSFVQHNSNPLVTTSPVVRYSVSGLRPQTRYTIRLSVLNGVSDQDSAGEEGRRSEVMATSGDISPQAPRSVTSFCSVIVWQAPFRAYGAIVGYDVMFRNDENSTMITKDRDELFHGVQGGNLPNGGENVVVQVRTKTDFADGIWSETVPLNCSSSITPNCPP